MKVVVTGASGFIGRNLCVYLRDLGGIDLIEVTRDTDLSLFINVPVDCIVHLAGISRSDDCAQFVIDNLDTTVAVLDIFKPSKVGAKFLFASTIHVDQDTSYAHSKRLAEDYLQTEGASDGWAVDVLRLPNLFGKWSRPNYNSFIATFIDQLLTQSPLTIYDPNSVVELLYIDDLLEIILSLIQEEVAEHKVRFIKDFPVYQSTVGQIACQLHEFLEKYSSPWMIDVSNPLKKRLHATFLSYMGLEGRKFQLNVLESDTGSFCEVFKREDFGQVSVLVIEPGACRGNHYHHTKCENFYLLKGKIRLTEIDLNKNEPDETDLSPRTSFWTRPGCVHTLENVGESDAVLLIWANEIYMPNQPDTQTISVQ